VTLHANLLRLIADAEASMNLKLPASVDGLRPGETPCVRFHNAPFDDVAPWLHLLSADLLRSHTVDGLDGRPIHIATYRGQYLSLPVNVKVYS
jgi:hypothetical protein